MPPPGYRFVEENLRTAMSCFAASKPEGEALDLPGLRLVFTGIPYAVFNAVMLTDHVDTLTDLRRRLDRAKDYFLRRRAPWSLWLCEDMVDPHVRSFAPALMAEYALEFSSHPPGMLAAPIQPPQRALPRLDYRAIDGTASRVDFCHVMAMAYEGPFATLMDAYNSDSFWQAGFRGVIGYRDGRAITTACTVESETSIGLYAVATVPGEQRRGYGEAVMRHALENAQRESTLKHVVLQSTPKGVSIYQRMGFAHVADFTIYVSLNA